ncbi:PTS sugar transporter subunit IIA [Lachnospiraceae bacterium 54-53]
MAVMERNQIIINQKFENKQELFETVGRLAHLNGVVDNIERFINGLNERENEMSTCFEDGIAIPHCRDICVKHAAVFIIKSDNNIEWDQEKNQANFIILLSVPKDENDTHIHLLSTVARKLVDETFKEKLLSLSDSDEIYESFYELVKG